MRRTEPNVLEFNFNVIDRNLWSHTFRLSMVVVTNICPLLAKLAQQLPIFRFGNPSKASGHLVAMRREKVHRLVFVIYFPLRSRLYHSWILGILGIAIYMPQESQENFLA